MNLGLFNTEDPMAQKDYGDPTQKMDSFLKAFDKCAESIGGGRRQIRLSAVRTLVRENREAASNVARVYSLYAASQPGAIQVAAIVALIYKDEFGDSSIADFVMKNAEELGLGDTLRRISLEDESGRRIGFEPRR
jgi:hypothetical protein